MIHIKNFTETDFEFKEVTRLFNLVSHDDKEHVDDMKDGWAVRDHNLKRDRLLLYEDDKVLGFLGYAQGRDVNNQNCYFNIFLFHTLNIQFFTNFINLIC